MKSSKPDRSYVNPMEWVGEAHNAGVRYVFGKLKFDKQRKPDRKRVAQLVVQYFDAAAIKGGRLPDFRRPPDPEEAVNSMIKQGLVTKAGARSMLTLLKSFERKLPLPKLLGEIERQERAAVGVLRNRDLLFFQAVASVARHSATLWAPVREGGEDFGHAGTGAPSTAKIDWGQVGFVDTVGMALLGPVGAAFGSLASVLLQLIFNSD